MFLGSVLYINVLLSILKQEFSKTIESLRWKENTNVTIYLKYQNRDQTINRKKVVSNGTKTVAELKTVIFKDSKTGKELIFLF